MNIKKTNLTQQISFSDKKIKTAPVNFKQNYDAFSKSNATITSVYKSDNETYITFAPKGSKIKINACSYDYDMAPYYLENKDANIKLFVESPTIIEDLNQVDDTPIPGDKGLFDTNIIFKGIIGAIDSEGYASVNIKEINTPINVFIGGKSKFQQGDQIAVQGVLDCELTEI